MAFNKKSVGIGLFLLALVIIPVIEPHIPTTLYYNIPNVNDYQIFENRLVESGKAQPWQISGKYSGIELGKDYIKRMEELETLAFLVIQNKEIIYERYWDNFDTLSISNSFSMAKSLVSFLIGIAIAEEKITSVEQPVGDFIPHYSKGDNAQLKIIDLLTMSSDLNWNESYINPFSATTEAYYGDDVIDLVDHLKVIEAPGKKFDYMSGNTQLLAWILYKATGVSLSEYASQKIWKPIGATSDALWSLDSDNGFEKAYCCFNTTARNFARLGQLMLDSGKWDNKQVVPRSYMTMAITPATFLVDDDMNQVNFYGHQVWVTFHNQHIIPYARGILGQYILTIPDLNMVVVRLGRKRIREKKNHHPLDVYLYLDAAFSISENKIHQSGS